MAHPQKIAHTAPVSLETLRDAITESPWRDENEAVKDLLLQLQFSDEHSKAVHTLAMDLAQDARSSNTLGVEAFLQQYRLDEKEGVLIMCLAEALLRIPDAHTADKLIEDKFSEASWEKYLSGSESFLINASAWGLMLTGAVVNFDKDDDAPLKILRRLVQKTGEPIVRQALRKAVEWMGTQFILGRTIEEGVANAKDYEAKGFGHSYDMLGEGARTLSYAHEYAEKYLHAIETIGKAASDETDITKRPSISIKLSALHPRYELRHKDKVMAELLPQLKTLMIAARKHKLIASIDAEEAARLDISLDIFEALMRDPDLADWNGISLVVQAYQKRAPFVIRWVAELARSLGRRVPLRLVKGAYWDSEIKHAQVHGGHGYPVYTRKHNTDVSYLACARMMLENTGSIYPMFATHNAHTIASIFEMAKGKDFEFQKLHGMGDSLYEKLISSRKLARCRIYAPIGVHKDLLAYLVRRLLENGANSSFIHKLGDKNVPLEEVVSDPVANINNISPANDAIPLPAFIYGPSRINSHGMDLGYKTETEALLDGIKAFATTKWNVGTIINGKDSGTISKPCNNPSDHNDKLGNVASCNEKEAISALEIAHKAWPEWAATSAYERAATLRRAGDLLESRRFEAIAMIARDGGRTMQDAIDEVREAVDFCRYYAAEIERLASRPMALPGPTGERNELYLRGRGVFFCISPWNFPLAIFAGQVVAALAAGNCVLAKPAEQTPIVAHMMVKILHDAGVPEKVLHLLPGRGSMLGKVLLSDKRIAGVVFTGSTDTAQTIYKNLADRNGPIVPFIAETGGQNCMIVDSSALPEQVTDDAISSAFTSAGQRCSALRVLFIQKDIADDVLKMLSGAAEERVVGNAWNLATDIGPVIDVNAQKELEEHKAFLRSKAKVIFDRKPQSQLENGSFVMPMIAEIDDISLLERENFGPILHVVRYSANQLDKVIDAINNTGYGLTLGVHSRIEQTTRMISERACVGNIYINRGMTGAVVGVQPFGGEGLSGTGPKAGGPHYLLRMMVERTVTNNITAVGGNIALYS